MIKWMFRLIWRVVWGKPYRPIDQIEVTRIGGGRAKPIQFGRMVVQIYLNRYPDGRVDPKFQLRRVAAKDGQTTAGNFYLKDIDDAVNALVRAKAWALDFLELE